MTSLGANGEAGRDRGLYGSGSLSKRQTMFSKPQINEHKITFPINKTIWILLT